MSHIAKRAAVCLLMAGLFPFSVGAEEKDQMPVRIDPDIYRELHLNSPFRRLLTLSDVLVLSGVARLPKPVVTVRNNQTNETFVVSSTPNEQGWKLINLTDAADLKKVTATIQVGEQVVSVRFDPHRLAPERVRGKDARPGRLRKDLEVASSLEKLEAGFREDFEGLEARNQAVFQQQFTRYLKSYPDASTELKSRFVRNSLQALRDIEIKALTPPTEKP